MSQPGPRGQAVRGALGLVREPRGPPALRAVAGAHTGQVHTSLDRLPCGGARSAHALFSQVSCPVEAPELPGVPSVTPFH